MKNTRIFRKWTAALLIAASIFGTVPTAAVAEETKIAAIDGEGSGITLGASYYGVYEDLRRKDLTRTQRAIYDKMVDAYRNSRKGRKTLRFNHATPMDVSYAKYAFNNTYCRYFGSIRGDQYVRTYSGYVTWVMYPLKTRFNRNRSFENERRLKKLAAKITKGKKGTKAKVLAINKYVCNKLTYRLNKGTLDLALRTRYAKCTGYAALFMALCHKSGIPCHMVVGYAGEPHAWNEVKISGRWYYIDPTWYDTSGREKEWLLSKKLWSGRFIRDVLHIVDFRQCGYTNGI